MAVFLASLTASRSSERPVHMVLTFHVANRKGGDFGVFFVVFGAVYAACFSVLTYSPRTQWSRQAVTGRTLLAGGCPA